MTKCPWLMLSRAFGVYVFSKSKIFVKLHNAEVSAFMGQGGLRFFLVQNVGTEKCQLKIPLAVTASVY
jgi:hypothetical protein